MSPSRAKSRHSFLVARKADKCGKPLAFTVTLTLYQLRPILPVAEGLLTYEL